MIVIRGGGVMVATFFPSQTISRLVPMALRRTEPATGVIG
jgi:hypothetical protein